MQAAIICKEYGWTWEEFQNQPHAFIQTILSMMEAEATVEKRNQRAKQASR